MQFFSPWAALAAIPTGGMARFLRELWQAATQESGTAKFLGFLIAAQVISILCYWLASLIFAPARANFRNAVVVWIKLLGVSIAAAIALVGATMLILAKAQGNSLAWLAIPALLLLALAAAIAVAAKIYDVSALRSFGLLVFQFVIAGVAGTVLQFAMLGLRPIVRADLLARLHRTAVPVSPEEGDVLRQGLNERIQALNRRREQLEIRSRHLPPNDPAALAEYEHDRAAYDRDLEEVKAAAAALQK